MLYTAVLLAPLLPGLAPPAPAQDPLEEHGGIRFGHSVLILGDLDGDGRRELAVGAPAAEGDVFQAGLVLVLSGEDRRVLQEWHGERRRQHFGHTLRAAGDVNGDGEGDVLVGYEFGARTEVRSGVDGALLLAFDRLHERVLPLGDANRDGAADFLLVRGSTMEARSGRDGSLLAGKLFLYDDAAVHAAGDLDGDGLTDVIVAAEEPVLWRSGRSEEVALEDTRLFHPDERSPLSELWSVEWRAPGTRIVRVESARGPAGEGEPDLVLSLRSRREGAVLGLSLRQKAPLFRIPGEPGIGCALGLVGDLDGDGVGDVLRGDEDPENFAQLQLYAHSGKDGAQLWRADWHDGGADAGFSFASLPSLEPGDAPRLLVGASDWDWHGTVFRNGILRVLAGATGEVLWKLDVDDVRPLGAESDDSAVYR